MFEFDLDALFSIENRVLKQSVMPKLRKRNRIMNDYGKEY